MSTTDSTPANRALNVLAWLILPTSLYLGACVAATVGAVVVTTVDVARDPRTVGTYVDDNAVEIKIRRALRHDTQIGPESNISVTAMNGIVLLTGETPENAQGRRAAAIARGYSEAREVINQITISGKSGVTSRMADSWITTKVKATLVRARDARAGRIKVVTERGTVYLMGLVGRAEADAAVDAVRRVRGVIRIVKVFEYI